MQESRTAPKENKHAAKWRARRVCWHYPPLPEAVKPANGAVIGQDSSLAGTLHDDRRACSNAATVLALLPSVQDADGNEVAEFELTELKLHEKLEDSLFAKP
jgi:hypothetical protein